MRISLSGEVVQYVHGKVVHWSTKRILLQWQTPLFRNTIMTNFEPLIIDLRSQSCLVTSCSKCSHCRINTTAAGTIMIMVGLECGLLVSIICYFVVVPLLSSHFGIPANPVPTSTQTPSPMSETSLIKESLMCGRGYSFLMYTPLQHLAIDNSRKIFESSFLV